MPRIRSLKPETLRQPELALVSPAAICCYTGLMPHANDYGRYRYHPRLIKADVYPMHTGVGEGQIEQWVDELLDSGLWCRYVVGERMHLHYPNWSELQRVDKPSQSLIPACPREPHGVLARSSEPSRALALEVEVEVEGKGKDPELLPEDGSSSAPNSGALVPSRSPRAAQAALGVIERLKADVDSGRRSWSFSDAAKQEWDALLDDDGNLSAARDFLVWFVAEMTGREPERVDWQMAMQKVKRWRGRALYGCEQAVTRVDSNGDGMALWRYVEAVCARSQAGNERSA